MKKKTSKKSRYPDYGTWKTTVMTSCVTLIMRKGEEIFLKIVFPTGQVFTFCPQEEIDNPKIIERKL